MHPASHSYKSHLSLISMSSGVQLVAEMLGHPLTAEEIKCCIGTSSLTGYLTLKELSSWWNSTSLNPHLVDMLDNKTATHGSIEGTGAAFG